MSDLCSPTFAGLAERLGFSCAEAGGIVEFRSPFALENWTLPVLEYTVIIGAVLALVYAIRRLRRHGDPTNIAVWFGALAYLFIIEPPLYFPGAFGISDYVDTMFAHNVFSVDFLWGRLPLYIVAIYPMMATVAFEIVRSLGVFRRYGTVVGALTVGFVHHAFYEIFDHLGPQLRWWEWSVDNPLNQPLFASVPFTSVVVFAALWPTSLAFFTQLLVGRHVDAGTKYTGGQIVWRTLVVGLLASLGTFILPLPATVFAGPNLVGVRTAILALELIALSVVGSYAIYQQWRRLRTETDSGPRYSSPLMVGYAAAYLVVMAVLWLTALPAYTSAVHGSTSNGDPIGDAWYALACFVIATACVAAVYTSRTPRTVDSAAAGETVVTAS